MAKIVKIEVNEHSGKEVITEKAYLAEVEDDFGSKHREQWIPKSVVEPDGTIKQWFAEKQGWALPEKEEEPKSGQAGLKVEPFRMTKDPEESERKF